MNMTCRFCREPLSHVFADLGFSPPSNSFLKKADLDRPEVHYPLKVFVCELCLLVQVDEYKHHAEIFSEDYVYFSSFSSTWLAHSKNYVDMIVDRLELDSKSLTVEIASNDGYLLQYLQEKGIPCAGIEPTASTAAVAIKKGIETFTNFWGSAFAEEFVRKKGKADLIIGNNVFAHVPDLHDFTKGLSIALADQGTITLEFPHVMRLIQETQFDTIYHEHFSYLSLLFCERLFSHYDLAIHDVEELSTHGGSLRVYVSHKRSGIPSSASVSKIREKEISAGLKSISTYTSFQARINQVKLATMRFVIEKKLAGKKIAAYGAAAKGNTFFNFCGIGSDLIDYVVDASPAKQGRFLPGSHIPVVGLDFLKDSKPDFVIILPWNLKAEIMGILVKAGVERERILTFLNY